MRWHEVWAAVVETMEADEDVSAVMGERIYLDGERPFEVPSLTGVLIADTEDERWAPVEFQLDIYTRTLGDLVQVESAVRRLLHHDVRVTIGGLRMWSEFTDGRSFFGPTTDGYFRRSLDFRFTPTRSRYVRVPAES